MEDFIIKDDWKEESKKSKYMLIFLIIIVIGTPLAFIFNYIDILILIEMEIVYIIMICIFLYFYLYSIKYKVNISKEKIILNTLFNHIEIDIKDIKKYQCKRYNKKSELFQFMLFLDNKKVLINTRYAGLFKNILEENNIIEENLSCM